MCVPDLTNEDMKSHTKFTVAFPFKKKLNACAAFFELTTSAFDLLTYMSLSGDHPGWSPYNLYGTPETGQLLSVSHLIFSFHQSHGLLGSDDVL